jgi:AraC-like DNA-binding protein
MNNINLERQFFEFQNTDLYITECGYEKCLPEHFYGPYKRNYCLIHFIIEGSGEYEFNNKKYIINKNQGFVIFPEDITKYTADKKTPWFYYLVGFNGVKAKHLLSECGINKENPIITSEKYNLLNKYIVSLYHVSKAADFNQFTMLGFLYLFFSCLNNKKTLSNKEQYINTALSYIRDNFMNDIKIETIADNLFLERSYLYRLFIESLGISPLKYLTKYRLDIACELLKNSNHNITDIAGYVGFASSSSFCKAFKNEFKKTPLAYRNYLLF